MYKCLSAILSLLMILSCPFAVQAATVEEIEQKYKAERAELLEQFDNGQLESNKYHDLLYDSIIMENYEKNQLPEAGYQILSEQMQDTQEVRNGVIKYMDWVGGSLAHMEDMKQYYADSRKTTVDQIEKFPEFTFSVPLPMSDINNMLVYGSGVLNPEYLREFVTAWIVVGYADAEPFCVFQIQNGSFKNSYLITGAYPSPIQASAYHELLLQQQDRYYTMPISYATIQYLELNDGKLSSMHKYDPMKKEETTIVSGEDQMPIYFKAITLASQKNMLSAVKYIDGSIVGGYDTVTVNDVYVGNKA